MLGEQSTEPRGHYHFNLGPCQSNKSTRASGWLSLNPLGPPLARQLPVGRKDSSEHKTVRGSQVQMQKIDEELSPRTSFYALYPFYFLHDSKYLFGRISNMRIAQKIVNKKKMESLANLIRYLNIMKLK